MNAKFTRTLSQSLNNTKEKVKHMRKFWRLVNSVEGSGSEIYIEGAIASEEYWGDESTPKQLREELKSISGNVTVVINSGGGDVWAGVAMYNALKELDAEVTVRVNGIAASIASVIAMAGDKIIMSPGSMMMIHRASAWAGGNADELEKMINMLEKVEESIIPIYADRTGLERSKIQEMLNAETWMSAEEAVALGFADSVSSKAVAEATSMSLTSKLAFSMEATKESIDKAMSHETVAEIETEPVAEAAETEEVEETNVSTDTAPATDEVVEPTEPLEPTVEVEEVEETVKEDKPVEVAPPTVENKAEKETPKMSTEIAKDTVLEPQNQATVEKIKPDMKQYLKSKVAMADFARILEKEAGNTSVDVKNAWKKHLETKMGVTNPDIFLPDALITRIEDAFQEGGEIWSRVSKTGAPVFRTAWDAEDDVSSNDGRGRGYNRSVEDEKAEQILTFADRVIRPQFIYKYIVLNREDVKDQQSTGALVTYVLSELPRRIIREIERAIVIGDGRANGSAYKINESSDGGIFSIKGDATSVSNDFARVYTPLADESRYSTLVKARAMVKAPGDRVLIAKEGFTVDLLLQQNANGAYLFAPGTNLAQALGFSAIIEPDWFTDATDSVYDAYIVTLGNYRTVGDTSIEAFTNFLLKTNQQEYLQEIYVGGGLSVNRSAVAITATTES